MGSEESAGRFETIYRDGVEMSWMYCCHFFASMVMRLCGDLLVTIKSGPSSLEIPISSV